MKQAQPRHTNRLADCTSPYLLQHAHNPVDWHPWGPEALELARRENRPIFLSIGYAACHWCHVMEREVFEKPQFADLMNQHFVNIKVDREERPDLDDLYMLATQIMSGSGGWPMSVWLTPDLRPFYAGTYFPPEDGFGRPGFGRLTLALADAWNNRRAELEAQAERVADAIRMHADEGAGGGNGTPGRAPAGNALAWAKTGLQQMADRFDDAHGGPLGAPKFPPHQALEFWLRIVEAEAETPGGAGLSPAEVDQARTMLGATLDGMMRGGIYDHVGGGFARYSTDEKWLVPHFEKMLYDNAQLAPIYAGAAVALHRPDYARVARETLDFFLREMKSGSGAFYSSLDADSEGAEGRYYVWTPDDVRAALATAVAPVAADEDVRLIEEHLGITTQSNWHESPVEGGSVLAVARTVEALAEERSMPPADVRHRLDLLLARMRKYRDQRVRPGLDDKVLTAWNGLMVSALAVTGRVLREPRYLEAAHRLIGFLLTHHMEGGRRLMRVSRDGPARIDAFLDDHAYLLNGLMDLIDSTTPTSLPGTMARKRALELADTLVRQFEDAQHGGFFFTAPPPTHEPLFARMKNAADNATPSPNGVAIRALLRLAHVSGKVQYRETALRAAAVFAPNIARRPEFFPTVLQALLEDGQEARRRGAGVLGPLPTMAPPVPVPVAVTHIDRTLSHDGNDAGESGLLKLTVESVKPDPAAGTFQVTLALRIAEGYHVQKADHADKEAYRTVARVRSAEPGENLVTAQEWTFPPPEVGDGWEGFSGRVEIRGTCTLARGVRPGRYRMRATVLTQVCSGKSCLAPERVGAEFALTIEG